MNMNQHQALTNTKTKALEFARMHDAAIDKALLRRDNSGADTHSQAATFLREAVPALVKSVFELDAKLGQTTAERQQWCDKFEAAEKRVQDASASLEKLITSAKTNVDYLRRGRRDPASQAAIKVVEDLHKQMVLLRNAMNGK
jgi:isochorismate synthase EntC